MRNRIIQLFIILSPVIILIVLLWIDLCPSGIKEITFEMGDSSPYVFNLLPSQRVSEIQSSDSGDPYVTIIDEPTYFSVALPHTSFDRVEVELVFDPKDQPVVELGGLADIYSESYQLEPLFNSELEQQSWSEVSDGQTRLLQHEHNFDSVQEFLENLPDQSQIATYHYDFEEPYRISNYQLSKTVKTIGVSLRGYHKYLTYLKNEPFYLAVDYMDMNRTTGADDAVIRVRNEEDEVMFEYFIKDDGDTIEDQISSDGTAIIGQSNWPEGVYSVELSGTSDIFWRSLETTQQYMTFVGKIYIADDIGYLSNPRATEFYTDAKHLAFETTHADSVQTVRVDGDMIGIAQSHEKYTYTVENAGVVYGYSSVGDLKISGDGKFAFAQSMFFNPDPVELNVYSDIDSLGVDYILTSYNLNNQAGDWLASLGSFDLGSLAVIDDTVKFTLSTPGLSEFGGEVDVHSITVRFLKDSMTWREILSGLRDLLPFGL
ncbi:hypothetical protein A2258_02975 [Candidatus Uhrbacteria bacterium RIFOXYA2_FULL_41_8]|nr:MAG: hypothetical protein A2258_02975 [Candidatus Uhrbacteria bacterium RIFOXYA2_FULL_41_8]